MKNNHFKYPHKTLSTFLTRTPYLSMVLLCFLYGSCKLHQQAFFVSDDKRVNIENFNKEMEEMMRILGVPSMALAVLENESVVFSNVYGYKRLSGLKKTDVNTVFEACSLSKIFLVYITYKLVDKGLLDLDVPLSDYLENYEALAHDPRYKKITARMILSHTSGIENWKNHNKPDILEMVSNPGEHFVYSGEGFVYLSEVIQSILKTSFRDYTQALLIAPLQLKNTFLNIDCDNNGSKKEKTTANFAYGYTIFEEEVDKVCDIGIPALPASFIHTTATDFSKLILSFFDTKHISEKSTKEMLSSTMVLEKLDAFSVHTAPGFGIIKLKDEVLIFFNGSNDGFKSTVLYSTTHKRGFIFFTNGDFGDKMLSRVNSLTTNFDLGLEGSGHQMYPSVLFDMLYIYREQGAEEMLKKIAILKREDKIELPVLETLANILSGRDKALAQKITSQ